MLYMIPNFASSHNLKKKLLEMLIFCHIINCGMCDILRKFNFNQNIKYVINIYYVIIFFFFQLKTVYHRQKYTTEKD